MHFVNDLFHAFYSSNTSMFTRIAEAHITEDLCRCFGGLERNGIQAELVAAVAYLGPGFLVAALRMWKYKVIWT